MKSFIVKELSKDVFIPMTVELQDHINRIKQNVQPDSCCISGYRPVSDKTTLKRRQILCNMIDWMASTSVGRQILTMTPQTIQIFSLSKRDKRDGDNFAESYGPEHCIIINPNQLHEDMRGECVNSLVHEMTHIINYNLKRHVLKTTYNNLNPYDEFCLSFFDEVSAHIKAAQVTQACIQKPHKISVDDIMTSKMYWHWHYGDILVQLTDYRRPMRQAKTTHTPSYYKLWRAYFDLHPELKWPKLVHYVHLGAKKMMTAIRTDMLTHQIEPNGKQLVDRYYPLLRHLRVQMSRGKERES